MHVIIWGLSAKDRGTTEYPASDLELNLSKTATNKGNQILLNKVLICRYPLVSNKKCKIFLLTNLYLQIRTWLPLLQYCSNLVPNHTIYAPRSLPTVCLLNVFRQSMYKIGWVAETRKVQNKRVNVHIYSLTSKVEKNCQLINKILKILFLADISLTNLI